MNKINEVDLNHLNRDWFAKEERVLGEYNEVLFEMYNEFNNKRNLLPCISNHLIFCGHI